MWLLKDRLRKKTYHKFCLKTHWHSSFLQVKTWENGCPAQSFMYLVYLLNIPHFIGVKTWQPNKMVMVYRQVQNLVKNFIVRWRSTLKLHRIYVFLALVKLSLKGNSRGREIKRTNCLLLYIIWHLVFILENKLGSFFFFYSIHTYVALWQCFTSLFDI